MGPKVEKTSPEVDCKTILSLRALLDRVLEHGGNLKAQSQWLQEGIPGELVALERTSSSEELSRVRAAVQELEMLSGLTDQISEFLRTERQVAKNNLKAMALRIGISSLPDDVLSDILYLATQKAPGFRQSVSDNELDIVRSAHSLSHVCQKFRLLILSNPHIWAMLNEGMVNLSQVDFCVKHSKKAPIHVFLDHFGLQRRHENFDKLLDAFLSYSQRWQTLRVGYTGEFNPHDINELRWTDVQRNLNTIRQATEGRSFPKLTRLCVGFNGVEQQYREVFDVNYLPYWRWSMPALVKLGLSGCHPPPAAVSFVKSLKDFSYDFLNTYYDDDDDDSGPPLEMTRLTSFLSSCDALEQVRLRYGCWRSVPPCPLIGIKSVVQADFVFSNCPSDVVEAICNSIHFPNADILFLTFKSFYISDQTLMEHEDEGTPVDGILDDIIRRCIHQHPLIKSLTVTLDQQYDRDYRGGVSLPLDATPSLERLDLSFYLWYQLARCEKAPSSSVRFPSLRTLTLRDVSGSDWHSVAPWVEEYLERLKAHGDLHKFERLMILESGSSSSSSLAGAIYDYLSPDKIEITRICNEYS